MLSSETKSSIIRAVLMGTLLAAFLFAGLGLFAKPVVADHAAMLKMMEDGHHEVVSILKSEHEECMASHARADEAISTLGRVVSSSKSEILGNQAAIRGALDSLNARVIETRQQCRK